MHDTSSRKYDDGYAIIDIFFINNIILYKIQIRPQQNFKSFSEPTWLFSLISYLRNGNFTFYLVMILIQLII